MSCFATSLPEPFREPVLLMAMPNTHSLRRFPVYEYKAVLAPPYDLSFLRR